SEEGVGEANIVGLSQRRLVCFFGVLAHLGHPAQARVSLPHTLSNKIYTQNCEDYERSVSMPAATQASRRSSPEFVSPRGDGDHASGACDFDVVARSRPFVAVALQPHVIAQVVERLLIEDERGGPALQVDTREDTCRAPDGDIGCPPADPYGDYARGH